MPEVVVGTCGYSRFTPGEGWQERYDSKLAAYAATFEAVELNRTFYTLPQVSTTERWQREAGPDFTFLMKGWQALTHPWGSPTWNNYREDVPNEATDDVGLLQPTDVNREAWAQTKARAVALDAPIVLLQTPPSFTASDEHAANMRRFLRDIDRGDLAIGWEPRGDWSQHPGLVKTLCDELDLLHVIDPFRATSVGGTDFRYYRLHGRNDDPYDYDYDYSADELLTLQERLTGQTSADRVYCLFNNYEKFSNAEELMQRLEPAT